MKWWHRPSKGWTGTTNLTQMEAWMMKTSTIGEILERCQARYLRVLPSGLSFPDGSVLDKVKISIRSHHPARTLYQNRKPVCRSLNGFNPLTKPGKSCSHCVERPLCTPQMLLTILIDLDPFYLLLAHTSLKNFTEFRQRNPGAIKSETLELNIRDRGSWGELIFRRAERKPTLFD